MKKKIGVKNKYLNSIYIFTIQIYLFFNFYFFEFYYIQLKFHYIAVTFYIQIQLIFKKIKSVQIHWTRFIQIKRNNSRKWTTIDQVTIKLTPINSLALNNNKPNYINTNADKIARYGVKMETWTSFVNVMQFFSGSSVFLLFFCFAC